MPVAANLLPKSFSCHRALLAAALSLLAAGVHAGAFTVLMSADAPAAHDEFVQQLRDGQQPGTRFDLVRIDTGRAAPAATIAANPAAATATAATAAPESDGDSVVTGVRTRSLRSAVAQADAPLTLAVGVGAARAAIERPGQEPLLLAMLSRLDYETLKAGSPALRRGERRVGVLLRDPAMADQLALIGAVLPQKRRIGVVATPESEPLVRELQRAAQGATPAWDVQVEYAPDASMLAAALRAVVLRSDALMVLPDLIGDSQAATLAVLHAGAGAGLPVFGASEGLVRSGGLAAAVSTPAQLAQQARVLARKMVAGGAGGGAGSGTAGAPLVEAATPASVRVNATVARGLGLRLPDERELAERIAVAR